MSLSEHIKKWRRDRYARRYKEGVCKDCGGKKQRTRVHLAFCLKCSKRKTASVRKLQASRRRNGVCIDCGGERAKGSVRCSRHHTARKAAWVEWSDKYRQKVFDHYGRKCACCGEREFWFLTIDHINNDGATHRRKVLAHNLYRWLCTHEFPDGFQVLCANCNTGKERNGGVCPHKEKRRANRFSGA